MGKLIKHKCAPCGVDVDNVFEHLLKVHPEVFGPNFPKPDYLTK